MNLLRLVIESNICCPRLTAAMILSGPAAWAYAVCLGEKSVNGGLEIDDGGRRLALVAAL